MPQKRYPKLNLPPCRLRISRDEAGQQMVWDELRSAWLVLTPEEWVRRHACGYLVAGANVPPAHIVQEYPVNISGMPQRADVVIIGCDGNPVMLIECKAASVEIDNEVYAQAVRYNSVVGARYIMLTNGTVHYIFKKNTDGNYVKCPSFPPLSEYFCK